MSSVNLIQVYSQIFDLLFKYTVFADRCEKPVGVHSLSIRVSTSDWHHFEKGVGWVERPLFLSGKGRRATILNALWALVRCHDIQKYCT